jgi:dolichol-phosphate mannosyltransferase
MAFVSVIVPVAPSSSLVSERIAGLSRSLMDSGHSAEVLAIADPRDPAVLNGLGRSVRGLVSEHAGKTASVYLGLREANGEYLVIIDLDDDYASDDLGRLLEPLIHDEADVVVAVSALCRELRLDREVVSPTDRRSPSRWIGALSRPLIGITDPSSGLVAISRASYQARHDHPPALGSRFVLELLVEAVGRRVEVPIRRVVRSQALDLRFNDLRLMKRLIDDRYGNLSRLFQFCVVGASGMVIDLSCYALFQFLLSRTGLAQVKTALLPPGQSLDLAVAGGLAIGLALLWNFSLNRRLTFNDARHGSLVGQFFAYVLGNALGIILSFTLRLILPSRMVFFQRHKLAAAVVGIVAATGISFSMSRWIVFSRQSPSRDGPHRRHPGNTETLAERV